MVPITFSPSFAVWSNWANHQGAGVKRNNREHLGELVGVDPDSLAKVKPWPALNSLSSSAPAAGERSNTGRSENGLGGEQEEPRRVGGDLEQGQGDRFLHSGGCLQVRNWRSSC